MQRSTKFIQCLGGGVTDINTAVDLTVCGCCCYASGFHDLDICVMWIRHAEWHVGCNRVSSAQ